MRKRLDHPRQAQDEGAGAGAGRSATRLKLSTTSDYKITLIIKKSECTTRHSDFLLIFLLKNDMHT
jgi:hypothetical protein